jgi:hypothetical protein
MSWEIARWREEVVILFDRPLGAVRCIEVWRGLRRCLGEDAAPFKSVSGDELHGPGQRDFGRELAVAEATAFDASELGPCLEVDDLDQASHETFLPEELDCARQHHFLD